MNNRYKMPVAVYIILQNDKDEVLLMRRKNTGFMDGLWSIPSGHVEFGESIITAIIRETNEEIGVSIKAKNINIKHIMNRKSNVDIYIDFFFICNKWNGIIKNNEPHKCSEIKWCNIEKLPRNVIPYIKRVLKNKNDILSVEGLS